ncbi:CTL-like protein DDB_G0274487 [Impatiens glandulifera]|uniref:CTL-like protein DDB_G0274487 n=1 Tax=Impatiens glandulifera TaxID=253017 RepID=UPI001FB104BB|nr:CTL-like protein DDB_G0274487 [Impatiens glandulifera]XP_047328711.1 CTL-like protein DDB_G0274487 [Impatiens glandulifera]XP_047328712.1 CTL-like protein DDB_G0274487 [Impatiens glandulifera]
MAEKSSNFSRFGDPSTSPIHPLLSSSSPSSIQDPTHSDSDQSCYIQITYNHASRQIKDIPILLLFSLCFLSTFAFGIFASINRNPSFKIASSFVYDSNNKSCRVPDSITHHSNSISSSNSDVVIDGLILAIVVTSVLSGPFALSVLWLLKRYCKQVVYFTVPFFVLLPVSINIYWFAACMINSTCSKEFPLAYRILVLVFVFLVIGVLIWIVVINWNRIELTALIIGISSNALWANLRLFIVLPCLTLGLLVYYVPIVVFLVFANENGKIVVREKKSGEYYCDWKRDIWVSGYYGLAIVTMIWSAAAMVEAQTYVISGTIAQWYFSKGNSTTRKSLRNSLRNGFGASFGTVCLSGSLICVVRIVRTLVDTARQENVSGMTNMLFKCCVNALFSAFDFLNKFAIYFAAITGEAYCSSAKMTYELLKRNLLCTAFVETVSTRLLSGIISVFSAAYAILVCAVAYGVSDLGAGSYIIGAMSWVLLMVVMVYVVGVIDDVIDTIYVCYAIDRDRGDVCRPEIHQVYAQLPIYRSYRSSLL